MWLPQINDPHVKVEINGTDETSGILDSKFVPMLVAKGIGNFTLTLANGDGSKSGLYQKGQSVKFYADNANGTTCKFWGTIDKSSENVDKDNGQTIKIEGRHCSYIASETQVCYVSSGIEPSVLLNNVIDQYLATSGFTHNSVLPTTKTMQVNWDYKPFVECVREICKSSSCDCYIDDDLDTHFFPANSVVNNSDAVVEGQNFLSMSDWGEDSAEQRTRITAIGQMSDGVTPIVYTAISPTETTIREASPIKDSSANTYDRVKLIADAALTELVDTAPQATVKSHFLPATTVGDNIWYALMRNKIFGQFKVMQIAYRFGTKVGMLYTETLIEKQVRSTTQLIEDAMTKQSQAQQIGNPSKLPYSYNFEFSDTANLSILTNAIVEGGWLKMSDAGSYVMTSIYSCPVNVSKAELRYVGKDMGQTVIRINCNSGLGNWTTLTKDAPVSIPSASQGTQVIVDISFISDSNNPNPAMDNMAILVGS